MFSSASSHTPGYAFQSTSVSASMARSDVRECWSTASRVALCTALVRYSSTMAKLRNEAPPHSSRISTAVLIVDIRPEGRNQRVGEGSGLRVRGWLMR